MLDVRPDDRRRTARGCGARALPERNAIDLDYVFEPEPFLKKALSGEHDMLAFDEYLGRERGSRLCAELRAAGERRPILLTSHAVSVDDGRALSVECGADAFAKKEERSIRDALRALAALDPIRPLAKVRREDLLQTYAHAFTNEQIRIDLRRGVVTRDRSEDALRKRAIETLDYIFVRAPAVVTIADLRRDVWRSAVGRSAISNVVSMLIESYPGWIERVDHRGYRARIKR